MLTTEIAKIYAQIDKLNTELHEKANRQKDELHNLLSQMVDTKAEIAEVAKIMAKFASDISDISEVLTSTAVKIEDAIEDPTNYLPECNYEDLIGWCEDCGKELTINSDYTEENGFTVCAEHAES